MEEIKTNLLNLICGLVVAYAGGIMTVLAIQSFA